MRVYNPRVPSFYLPNMYNNIATNRYVMKWELNDEARSISIELSARGVGTRGMIVSSSCLKYTRNIQWENTLEDTPSVRLACP